VLEVLDVFAAVVINGTISWDMTPCSLSSAEQETSVKVFGKQSDFTLDSRSAYSSEDGGDNFSRNVGLL
jgi:hypothetical protein